MADRDPLRGRGSGAGQGLGRRAIAVRLVLLALGQAAMVSGSSTIEFGTRNLALHSALSHRTVSRVLRILRDEPDPLIDLVSPRRMARADRYALRIPDRYADSVRWRRRRAGRIEAAHPAFLVLGGTVIKCRIWPLKPGSRRASAAMASRMSWPPRADRRLPRSDPEYSSARPRYSSVIRAQARMRSSKRARPRYRRLRFSCRSCGKQNLTYIVDAITSRYKK